MTVHVLVTVNVTNKKDVLIAILKNSRKLICKSV